MKRFWTEVRFSLIFYWVVSGLFTFDYAFGITQIGTLGAGILWVWVVFAYIGQFGGVATVVSSYERALLKYPTTKNARDYWEHICLLLNAALASYIAITGRPYLATAYMIYAVKDILMWRSALASYTTKLVK